MDLYVYAVTYDELFLEKKNDNVWFKFHVIGELCQN